MRKFDLSEASPAELRAVVIAVYELAVTDFGQKGAAARRSGRELCNMYATRWRMGHVRMLSGLYNKTVWSFAAAEEERLKRGRARA